MMGAMEGSSEVKDMPFPWSRLRKVALCSGMKAPSNSASCHTLSVVVAWQTEEAGCHA